MTDCRVCAQPFERSRPLQAVCSLRCAKQVPKRLRKAERADTKRRKEAVKTVKELTKEAQAAFNRFIRLRDYGRPCICCGSPMNWNSDKPGGEIDAGHYLSIGSAPHMRFVEGNVHAQRKSCNQPGGAKRQAFRLGMIERIGLAAVEVLEADQTLRKYTADQLREIRDGYKAKAKVLKAKLEMAVA